MYRIFLNSRSQKELNKLQRDISQAIKRILLGNLKEDPFSRALNIKKLQPPLEGYRLRVGEYRVLFDIEEDSILIYSIKHRKDAYR
ncbi:MAG TPA: type II toxin-antitoxin system RelE/ParE family toxin [Candidatus Paceibacterota bacterium]|nr:type II toxin-antitoxin system RelE/ParE family toxin [Candidatus Paceibacterota bacterium]